MTDLVKEIRDRASSGGSYSELWAKALEYIENMESMIEWMENMDPKLVHEARIVLWREKGE